MFFKTIPDYTGLETLGTRSLRLEIGMQMNT